MRKYDFAVIGELNVDIIMSGIDNLPEIGKERFARNMMLTLGSSSAIFASNASVLGSRVCICGMIGRDYFGSFVRESLDAKGVDTSFVVESDTPTGATLCMNYGEDRANITYQGSMNEMSYGDIDPALFESTDHIHLCAVFFQKGILSDLQIILDKAIAGGVTVSLDPQCDPAEKWDIDYKSVLPKVDLFMPNENELMGITGTRSLSDGIAAVLPYLKGAMIVKCGSKGSVLVKKDGSRNDIPAFDNPFVVDTIGAGDSFDAGFISAYVRGLPLEDCQSAGNLTGALNTTAEGGTGAFNSLAQVRQNCLDIFGQELKL